MKSNILIHIPHSSLKFPLFFKENVLISESKLNKENLELTDLYVDKLVLSEFVNKVIFDYSRLFCDVERFREDELESMSKIGMGSLYTHTSDRKKFIEYDFKYKEKVLKYYDEHHDKLNLVCSKILNKYNECIIIDLHSFSDLTVSKLFNLNNTPDICIGIDNDFQNKKLIEFTFNYFKDKGYLVNINYPYSGTIVPNKVYYNKDSRVTSIMIEINKRIYLDNDEIDSIKFEGLQKIFNEYLEFIKINF